MRIILITFIILLLAQPVWANNSFSPGGSTFFTDGKLDRIYFDDDGVFYQQLESDWDAITAGELLRGQWNFNAKTYELCLDYTQPDFKELCFDVVKNYDDDGFAIFDKNGKIHLQWVTPRAGNWLLSIDGLGYLKQVLDDQSAVVNNDDAIKKYLENKILMGVDGPLERMRLYLKPLNEGVYIGTGDKVLYPLVWDVQDGYLVLISEQADQSDRLMMTIGQEFSEEKPPQIIYYDLDNKNQSFEGVGFTLKPAEGHENLGLFQ